MEDIFKEILNQVIKPIMKSANFKKKALNFYKNNNGLVYLINIQKSAGNSYQEIGFYVNCCIHSNIITEELEQDIIEFPKEYQCHFNKRIESLFKNTPEKFLINSSTNIEVLKKQINISFKDLVNYLEAINDNNSFVQHLSKNGTLQQNEVFRYCIKKGLSAEAQNLVKLFKSNIDENRWNGFFKKGFIEILKEENSKLEIEYLN